MALAGIYFVVYACKTFLRVHGGCDGAGGGLGGWHGGMGGGMGAWRRHGAGGHGRIGSQWRASDPAFLNGMSPSPLIPTGVLDVGQNAGHQVRVKEDGHGGCDGALGGWHGGMGGGMAPTPAGAAAAGLIMTPPPPSPPRRHRRRRRRRRRCHPRCRPCIQGPLSALVTRFSSLGGGESATAGAGPILYAVAGSAAAPCQQSMVIHCV